MPLPLRSIVRRAATPSLLALSLLISGVEPVAADEPIGLRAPEGFAVTLYADDDLAHDVHAMTIDSLGRVVVSGPGYVRILVDADGDGRAESFRQYADGPQTGAQGLCFHGRDLLCAGDAGLIRYRDADADDRADGPPDVFLRIAAGNEHHVHAIRRGPDGWWYVIAGNDAGVTAAYASRATSPVRRPEAGTILRLDPDLAGGEILCDGFRNAYDFDFHPTGELFVFDSDGERDVSLPWYRPTRVFQALPGSHAGWISENWKRPDHFADMPPVLASFGRGSPTGVECYRHDQFPERYRGATFVLDWTFGRVFALPVTNRGASWATEPIAFLSGVGQFGFAPTDVAVGPDGSLFVSVGGRGTRGGVYRVRWVGDVQPAAASVPATDAAPAADPQSPRTRLLAVLDAHQPLSSWSRAAWMPAARTLGREPFVAAALDAKLTPLQRMRAVEILVELFGGIDAPLAQALAKSESPSVRARTAWALGRRLDDRVDLAALAPFVDDADFAVQRVALESLLGRNAAFAQIAATDPAWLARLVRRLGSPDRFVRLSAAKVVAESPTALADAIEVAARRAGPQAHLAACLGRTLRSRRVDLRILEAALATFESTESASLKLQAARVMQLALGDAGPREKRPAAFEGYASRLDLEPAERALDPLRIRATALYPTGQPDVDVELSRALALLQPYHAGLLAQLLTRLGDESHPVDDVHQLLVAARIPIERNARQSDAIARALVELEPKIRARKLTQDTHWNERIRELYAELVRIDPALPAYVVRRPGFGLPGHVVYLSELAAEDLPLAVTAFAARIAADAEYAWTNDVVFVLGESTEPAHRALVRSKYDDFAVRGAVLSVLAAKPEPADREKFVAGLDASQLEVLTACVSALEQLPPSAAGAEQFALLRTARRLGTDKGEFPLRERVVKLLRRDGGEDHGFVFGEAGFQPQPAVFAKWSAALTARFPDLAATQPGGSATDLDALRRTLAEVDWTQADAERGKALFAKRSCTQCHGGGRALGPDLAGAAKRFSRDDLFVAIALPSRDVSPRYQTTLIQTVAGKVYAGLVIYESVEGVLLRNASNQTFRIETRDVEVRRTLPTSLMPEGLLRDLTPRDLADLDAYVRTLGQ